MEVFATERQKWMDAENEALNVLAKAQELAGAGQRDEALGMAARVSSRSLASSAAESLAAALKTQGCEEW